MNASWGSRYRESAAADHFNVLDTAQIHLGMPCPGRGRVHRHPVGSNKWVSTKSRRNSCPCTPDSPQILRVSGVFPALSQGLPAGLEAEVHPRPTPSTRTTSRTAGLFGQWQFLWNVRSGRERAGLERRLQGRPEPLRLNSSAISPLSVASSAASARAAGTPSSSRWSASSVTVIRPDSSSGV